MSDERPWWLGDQDPPQREESRPRYDERDDEISEPYEPDRGSDTPPTRVPVPQHASPDVTVGRGYRDDDDQALAPPRRPPPSRPRPSSSRPTRSGGSKAAPATSNNGANWPARIGLLVLLAIITVAGGLFWRSTQGDNPFAFFSSPPAATPTGYAQSAHVTFTRTTQDISTPSSTLTAATDGSGNIAATQLNASVTQVSGPAIDAGYQPASSVTFTLLVTNSSSVAVTSGGGLTLNDTTNKVTCSLQGNVQVPAKKSVNQQCIEPLQAEPAATWNYTDPATKLKYTGSSPAGGNTPYYYVPKNCGDPTAVEATARQALQQQIGTPSGDLVQFGPTYNISTASLACNPSANHQEAQAFTYTQTISGSASETVFALADVQAYQTAQLKTKVPSAYILLNSSICPDGPKVGSNATASHATITCPTTGVAAWNWTTDALAQLASSLAGAEPGTATLQLNQTAGIVAGSAKIDLTNGSVLPQDPSKLSFSFTP